MKLNRVGAKGGRRHNIAAREENPETFFTWQQPFPNLVIHHHSEHGPPWHSYRHVSEEKTRNISLNGESWNWIHDSPDLQNVMLFSLGDSWKLFWRRSLCLKLYRMPCTVVTFSTTDPLIVNELCPIRTDFYSWGKSRVFASEGILEWINRRK